MLTQELLVIVSGYPSSIDPALFNHPSEKQIFQQAAEFGSKVKHLAAHCFECTGPIVPIIQRILDEYYALVVSIEQNLAAYDLISIIAATVGANERVIDYCCLVVSSERYLDTKMAVQLRRDCYSGVSTTAAIARDCLAAVDRYYIQQMTPWLMWGTMPKVEIDYPEFEECSDIIYNIGDCLRVITYVHATKEFSLLSECTHETLANLKFPLENRQLRDSLQKIQAEIISTLLPRLFSQLGLPELLVVLEKIVLCGSSLFCMSFEDVALRATNQDHNDQSLIKAAILSYTEDTKELSPKATALAVSMIHLQPAEAPAKEFEFNDLLTGTNMQAELVLDPKLGLFISTELCDIYGEIFYYLLTVRQINDSLKQFSTQTQKFKIFLTGLWGWYQRQIKIHIESLGELFGGSESLDAIVAAHMALVKLLGKRLLLNSRSFRTSLRRILQDAALVAQGTAVDDGSIQALISGLSRNDEFAELLLVTAM